MNAEIICVVAEEMPEEHSAFMASYISKKLFELGHRTLFEKTCAPDRDALATLLNAGLERSDIILVLGGIEPESKSVSKMALSAVSGQPLVSSDIALQSVKEYCQSIGAEPTPEHISASVMLKGADVLKNDIGLCPGLVLEVKNSRVILLPYAEGELIHMFETRVAPLLSTNGVNVTHTINVVGLSSDEIEAKLKNISGRSDFAVTLEKHGFEYVVRVSAVAQSKQEAELVCSKAVASVTFALGKSAYAVDSNGIQFETVRLLTEKGLTVSTAESCTGGMVSEMLTDVGGSSKVFEYGVSAYSNRIKTEILKVPAEIIDKHGAVSRETAKLMAINVRALSGADLGIAITGNAGPSASEGKPVGLVYIGVADKGNYTVIELNLSAKLDRDEIRNAAATLALDYVRKYADHYPSAMPGMMKYSAAPVVVSAPMVSPAEAPAAKEAVKAEPEIIAAKPDSSINTAKTESAETGAPLLPLDDFGVVFDRDTDGGFVDTTTDEYSFINRRNPGYVLRDIGHKFADFLKTVIPWKGDSPKKVFIKCGFCISLLTLIASSTVLFIQLTGDNAQREIITEAQKDWDFDGERTSNDTFTAFEPFLEENEDIRGWITVPGTKVDNPIYQTTDNDYYLTHNMYKEKSRYGALFFDYRCNLSNPNSSQNLIVYGHEMKDGSMFGTLKNYKKLNFYKQNPTFTVTQLSEQYTYKIFAVMIMNAKPEDDKGYMYNYVKTGFSSQAGFTSWIEEARERSLINTTVDVVENDQIITLVTCINDFKDARLVIMARQTRVGEDSAVSTAAAALNPNPRYPQAWYDKRGLAGYSKPETSLPDSSDETSSDAQSEPVSSDVNSSDATTPDGAASGDGTTSDDGGTPSSGVPSSSTESASAPSSSVAAGGSSDTGSSNTPESSSDTTTTVSTPAGAATE